MSKEVVLQPAARTLLQPKRT